MFIVSTGWLFNVRLLEAFVPPSARLPATIKSLFTVRFSETCKLLLKRDKEVASGDKKTPGWEASPCE